MKTPSIDDIDRQTCGGFIEKCESFKFKVSFNPVLFCLSHVPGKIFLEGRSRGLNKKEVYFFPFFRETSV